MPLAQNAIKALHSWSPSCRWASILTCPEIRVNFDTGERLVSFHEIQRTERSIPLSFLPTSDLEERIYVRRSAMKTLPPSSTALFLIPILVSPYLTSPSVLPVVPSSSNSPITLTPSPKSHLHLHQYDRHLGTIGTYKTRSRASCQVRMHASYP